LIPEYLQKLGEFDQNLLPLPSFKNMAKIVKVGQFCYGKIVKVGQQLKSSAILLGEVW
jgi:hypothetical protein